MTKFEIYMDMTFVESEKKIIKAAILKNYLVRVDIAEEIIVSPKEGVELLIRDVQDITRVAGEAIDRYLYFR